MEGGGWAATTSSSLFITKDSTKQKLKKTMGWQARRRAMSEGIVKDSSQNLF
jgi:hypothetical protein